jgi:cation diffusion facilitator CzcD-associated flavoprotein CzcO
MSFGQQSRRRTDGTVVVIGAGQSGLAAARVLLERNVATIVLEARDRPAGSWPYYYDSLQAFRPQGSTPCLGCLSLATKTVTRPVTR